MKRNPGFKATQSRIARIQNIPSKAAGAILADASRRASSKAKARNPRLARVKGSPKGTPAGRFSRMA